MDAASDKPISFDTSVSLRSAISVARIPAEKNTDTANIRILVYRPPPRPAMPRTMLMTNQKRHKAVGKENFPYTPTFPLCPHKSAVASPTAYVLRYGTHAIQGI